MVKFVNNASGSSGIVMTVGRVVGSGDSGDSGEDVVIVM